MRGQETLVGREQGSHSPTSTSGSWMGQEKERDVSLESAIVKEGCLEHM